MVLVFFFQFILLLHNICSQSALGKYWSTTATPGTKDSPHILPLSSSASDTGQDAQRSAAQACSEEWVYIFQKCHGVINFSNREMKNVTKYLALCPNKKWREENESIWILGFLEKVRTGPGQQNHVLDAISGESGSQKDSPRKAKGPS